MKPTKILVIVSHPDDESLWVGGLLNLFQATPGFEVYILCLWGCLEKPDAHREAEFYRATRAFAGSYIFTDRDDAPLKVGLDKLRLAVADISLLITHSPYGDEHKHPHHKALHQGISKVASDLKIPFAFFSFAAMPWSYESLMQEARRLGRYHLLNVFRCRGSNPEGIETPQFFVQFLVDPEIKASMLSCYQSINRKEHEEVYFAWTSNCEGLYLRDEMAFAVIERVISKMDVPARCQPFA